MKKQKTKKLYPKEWSKKHIFYSYLFIFLCKQKRMLKFPQDGLSNGTIQEIMDKKVSLEVKTHFSVSDHVTWGVVRWRHKLNHTCPQWMVSKFGPMKAYMCWVTANSFFPSNGLKRYCNGPLKGTGSGRFKPPCPLPLKKKKGLKFPWVAGQMMFKLDITICAKGKSGVARPCHRLGKW